MKRIKIILLFIIYWFNRAVAQDLEFKNIGINQGLPSSEVYRVIQDKKGFIWMSTDAGVVRFNGNSFKCYTTADGLPDNTVFDLVEDAKGRIWMNCYNGSIAYLEDEKIIPVAASGELKSKLKKTNSIVSCIQFDKAQNLWIGTTESMYKLMANENYSKLYSEFETIDSVQCLVKILDNSKTIESANNGQIDILNKIAEKQKIYFKISGSKRMNGIKLVQTNEPFNPKFCSMLLHNGSLIFSYRSSLVEINSSGKQIEWKFPKTIISLNQDRYGNVWVGLASGGVYMYVNGQFSNAPQRYLANYSVSSIQFDKENGIWLSTFEKGIFYAPFLNYFSFSKFPDLKTSIAGLGNYGSRIYVATTSNSILEIDRELNVRVIPYQKETNLSNRINFYSYQNQLVICGNKIAFYDTLRNSFQYPRSKSSLTYFGTSVSEDKSGNLAFVAQGYYYILKKENVHKIGKLPARATSIFKTKQNQLLIGTLSGLFYFQDTSWVPINHPILRSERINYITEDKHQRLFVATKNNGLFIRDQNKWISITKKEGLASDICNYVLCDEKDTVWVAGNKGISFFKNSYPYSIQTITGYNGLPSNEVSALARRANQLFVGTKEGLCMIQLNQDYLTTASPEVYISTAKETKNGKKLSNHIQLHYSENNLRFFVECPSYKKVFSPSFSYRLKGYSDSLMHTDKEILEFQNLSPGDYSLEVKATRFSEVDTPKSTYFYFSIHPPFWKTAWFIFMEIISAAVLIYGIIYWRITKIRKQEQHKTLMNTMVTESRMAALQAQMNPHFIFNAINSIQSFVLNNDTQNAYDYLAKFAKLVRLVLNNSKHNSIKLQTEIETLTLYVQMEQIRFKNSFEFSCTLDKSMEDISEISIPVMLIQPFIENAIWHGIMPLQDARKGKIELIFSQSPHFLEISIRDNGIGRKASQRAKEVDKHKSLGMQLVQERLALIESHQKRKASMQATDLFNENNEVCGTQIHIKLPQTL